MKCKELIELFEKLAPTEYACEWDNVGLLAGSYEKEVKKIYIALDATDQVIEDAVSWGADLLLTHHPLIFKPLKKVNDKDFIARRIMKLIQNDISYYAMHTNFDASPGCMADAAAKKLELTSQKILDKEGTIDQVDFGIGKIGYLKKEMTVREVAELVKDRFGLPFLTLYGEENANKKVRLLGISPGSGKSAIKPAIDAGVQVLVTGDIGHHDGIDAAANDMSIINAGHYGLEYLFMDFMEGFLKKEAGNKLDIRKAEVTFPETLI
jgi:dinuclear metal center YbgI/SA1388 family protein